MAWAALRTLSRMAAAIVAERRAKVLFSAADYPATPPAEAARLAAMASCLAHYAALLRHHARPHRNMPRAVLAAERRGFPHAR